MAGLRSFLGASIFLVSVSALGLTDGWECGVHLAVDESLSEVNAVDVVACQLMCGEQDTCDALLFEDGTQKCQLFRRGDQGLIQGPNACTRTRRSASIQQQDQAPADAITENVRFCSSNRPCRRDGDTQATCDTLHGICQCSPGYGPQNIGGIQQYLCFREGIDASNQMVPVVLNIVFPNGNCAVFRSRGFASRLLAILARITRRRFLAYSIVCGSVSFQAQGEFIQQDIGTLEDTLAQDVQREVAQDPELSETLGSTVTSDISTVDDDCIVPFASKSARVTVSGNSVCTALECLSGYVKQTGASGAMQCVLASDITGPVACVLETDCPPGSACTNGQCAAFTPGPVSVIERETRVEVEKDENEDDDTLTLVIAIVLACLVCLALAILALFFCCKSSATSEEPQPREEELEFQQEKGFDQWSDGEIEVVV